MSDGIGYQHRDATYYLVHDDEPDLRSLAGHAHRRVKIRGRALEVSAMTSWKRWQDWSVVVLGVIMFLTPFVFGQTAQTIPAILAVVLFVSPWIFGFTAVTALAWSAWIVAILVVLAIGSLYPVRTRRATA